VVVNLVTIIGLALGLLNNAVIASVFGLTARLDAYFTAIVIPMMFMTLFVDFVGKNFLPIYSELAKQPGTGQHAFASSVINFVFLVTAGILVILVVVADLLFHIIAPGFSAEIMLTTVNMFHLMAGSILLMSVSPFFEYIWQYHNNFIRVVMANLWLPFSLLLAVLLLHDRYQEYSLALGYIAGQLLRFLTLVFGLPLKYRTLLHLKDPHFIRVIKNSGILVSTGVIARIRPAIVRIFASTLQPGAISAYAMSLKLTAPINQTATIGVRMMAFSKSSKLFARDRLDDFGELYNNVILAVQLVIIALTSWFLVNGDGVVAVLFQHGEFDIGMHANVVTVLYGLLPSVALMAVCQIMSNSFYALDRIAIPAIVNPLGTVVYVLAIFLLVDDYGLFGIAFANTIAYILVYLVFGVFLGKYVSTFQPLTIFMKFVWYSALSVAIFYATDALLRMFSMYTVIKLMMSLAIGGFAYLLVLKVLNDRGLVYIITVFSRKQSA